MKGILEKRPRVLVETQGEEGVVSAPAASWQRYATWLGPVLLGVGAALAFFGRDGPAVGAIAGGAFVVLMESLLRLQELALAGMLTRLTKLEVVRKADQGGDGYRQASVPGELIVRLPHRELPLSEVKSVTQDTRLVSPKNGDSYWVYAVYIVLPDEVLSVASYPRQEGQANALADRLCTFLRVRKSRANGSTTIPVGLVVGMVVLIALFVPLVLSLGRSSFVQSTGPRWAWLLGLAGFIMFPRFAVIPSALALARPYGAAHVRRAFGIEPRRQGLPWVRVVASAVGLSALAGAVAWVGLSGREQAAEATVKQKQPIERWAWGHDAMPLLASLNGDDTPDYIGAFASRERNGYTVVAGFDGATHETLWRTPPLLMNVGHNHFALAGDTVMVLESGKPPRLLDARTGQARGAFPDDAAWSKLNPSRICADPAATGVVVISGHRGGQVTLRVDLGARTLKAVEPVPWCTFAQGPGSATPVVRPPIDRTVAVGDYQLTLAMPSLIHRGGKLIKQFELTDVQSGPMCGRPAPPEVWVPVAAGGGVLISLETAERTPAERPAWCPAPAARPGEPALPDEGPDGAQIRSRGLVSGEVLVTSASAGQDTWLVAYDKAGRELRWKAALPRGMAGAVGWDAAAGRVVVVSRADGPLTARVFSLGDGEELLSQELEGSAGAQLHGVVLGERAIYIAHGNVLDVLDAGSGARLARHGAR